MFEALERTLNHSVDRTYAEMKRGLSSLGSIASTAPFVGFFGTWIGIVSVFKGCGGDQWTCLAATFEGISEALMPAALGLAVAILTLWGYRYLSNRVDAFKVEMEGVSADLLNYLSLRCAGAPATIGAWQLESKSIPR
jgi:biopolymer transport protein ExbB/TolQ